MRSSIDNVELSTMALLFSGAGSGRRVRSAADWPVGERRRRFRDVTIRYRRAASLERASFLDGLHQQTLHKAADLLRQLTAYLDRQLQPQAWRRSQRRHLAPRV